MGQYIKQFLPKNGFNGIKLSTSKYCPKCGNVFPMICSNCPSCGNVQIRTKSRNQRLVLSRKFEKDLQRELQNSNFLKWCNVGSN